MWGGSTRDPRYGESRGPGRLGVPEQGQRGLGAGLLLRRKSPVGRKCRQERWAPDGARHCAHRRLTLTLGLSVLVYKIRRLEYKALRPLKILTVLRKLETGFLGDKKMRAKVETEFLR